jgi:hypothetical protein
MLAGERLSCGQVQRFAGKALPRSAGLVLCRQLASDHHLDQAAYHHSQPRPGNAVQQRGEAELIAIVRGGEQADKQPLVVGRPHH